MIENQQISKHGDTIDIDQFKINKYKANPVHLIVSEYTGKKNVFRFWSERASRKSLRVKIFILKKKVARIKFFLPDKFFFFLNLKKKKFCH